MPISERLKLLQFDVDMVQRTELGVRSVQFFLRNKYIEDASFHLVYSWS